MGQKPVLHITLIQLNPWKGSYTSFRESNDDVTRQVILYLVRSDVL